MLLKVKNKWTTIHTMYTKQNGLHGGFQNRVEPAQANQVGQPSKRNVAAHLEKAHMLVDLHDDPRFQDLLDRVRTELRPIL